MGRYSRCIVKNPFVLIFTNIALAFVLGPLTIFTIGLPDFSDPQQGFQPMASRLTVLEATAAKIFTSLINGSLSYYPLHYVPFANVSAVVEPATSRRKRSEQRPLADVQTCANVIQDYKEVGTTRIVVQSKTGANVFTAEHLHSICRIEDKISAYHWPGKECYLLSLPFYVTALTGKASCYDVTAADVDGVLELLEVCSPYYFSGALTPYCHLKGECSEVPIACGRVNAVYVILHVFTDDGFMKDGNVSATDVHFSLVVLPRSWYAGNGELLKAFFQQTFEHEVVEDGDIFVPAVSMNIENELFSAYLQQDLVYYGVAMALVILVLLLYLQSVVLVLAVVGNVIITLCLSYFIYHYVVRLTFFPFINLIAALLLIAVGADDVFILYDLWRHELRHNPDASYEEITSETLKKGGLSIFVTSLTTAASLLANLASQITTIRCFGIFAGICILVNFVIMITWIPALIVLIDKTFNYCCRLECRPSKLTKVSDYFWGVVMVKVVTVGAPVWVVVLLIVGGLGLVGVFVKPGLRLPEDNYFKVFSSDNPLEVYRRQYSERTRFEQQLRKTDTMRLAFVWGAKPVDDADVWDPRKDGSLKFVPVDVYSAAARSWYNEFCGRLKRQPFVRDTHRDDDCYFEVIDRLISGPCVVPAKAGRDIRPCCEMESTPNRSVYEECIRLLLDKSGAFLDRLTGRPVLGEVLFDGKNDVKLFSYSFDTSIGWTPNYVRMDGLVKDVEAFGERQMAGAPDGLDDGWFASFRGDSLVLYDVQKALSRGTMLGIGLSLACSFVVLLLTTLNVIISLYAIVTIALIIGATVGTLVLLGWELNVTESLTITMSLGLAVDFTIHYGVAYKLAKSGSRAVRIKETVGAVSSAITMAALTTFISGASVLNARVQAYAQFGLFLVFVMFYSWIFSTFLFLPICFWIGPLGDAGDVAYLFRCCCRSMRKSAGGASSGAAASGTGEMNGIAPASRQYENLADVPPAYFRKPDLSSGTFFGKRSSLDRKFLSSPDAVDRYPSNSRDGGSPYVIDTRERHRHSQNWIRNGDVGKGRTRNGIEYDQSQNGRHHIYGNINASYLESLTR